jgi:mannose/cellobiose epimerase-like protein (N-acyl-D-glucosamine 2-epimerase family)
VAQARQHIVEPGHQTEAQAVVLHYAGEKRSDAGFRKSPSVRAFQTLQGMAGWKAELSPSTVSPATP